MSTKTYDVRKYQAWCFDDYFCLKPPFVLTAAIIYLCRSFLLFGLVLATSARGQATGMEALLPAGDHPTSLAITALPALMVLFALFRRSPKAGVLARWAWKHGRVLLAASAVLEIAASVLMLGELPSAADFGSLRLAFLILDVYILVYVLASKRVRDSFSDFPPSPAVQPDRHTTSK
jgi:hypothetical protein